MIGFSAWTTVKLFCRPPYFIKGMDFERIHRKRLGATASILFIMFILGNLIFWYDVNSLIGINTVIQDAGYFKHIILSGQLQDNAIRYFGRNFTLTGAIITLAYYVSGQKKKYLLMLIVFVLLSLINVRREPMILKLSSVLIVFFLVNRGKLSYKTIKQLVIVGLLFLVTFLITTSLLNPFGDMGRIMFSYTAGSFSSLQGILIDGYPTNTQLPLGYTLYFVYSILEYLSPNLTPPSIILSTISSRSTNVYTALAYVAIDSGGEVFLLMSLTLLYAIFVGVIYGVSIVLINKKINFFTISVYSTVVSLSIRSFMNPAFSHMDLPFALFYGILLNSVISIRRKENRIKTMDL
jgi:hypothetical protein